MKTFNFFRKLWLGLGFLTLWMTMQSAQAAWWEFGRAENEPVITELKFNKVDAFRVEDRLTIGKDELEQGAVVIRGRAEIGKGTIGAVELTLDAGKTWTKAVLGDRGMFTFELKPELQQEYQFSVRALTTTGAMTDAEEHAFKLVFSSESAADEVKKTFAALLDAYRNENKSAFMRLVSPDFEGIVSALEDALSDDFRFLDNIRIEPNITRLAPAGKNFDLYFTFNRSVTGARSGQVVRDSAATTMTFERTAEGFKLSRMAAPLIFGVSNPEDVATSVTGESVGKSVLALNPKTGAAATSTQGKNVGTAASMTNSKQLVYNNTGPGILWYSQSFDFDTESVRTEAAQASPPINGDFAVFGDNFHITTKAGVLMAVMGNQSIDTVAEAPAAGYSSYATWNGYKITGAAARTFAFKLPGGVYAVVEFTSLNVGSRTAVFKYKVSESGRTF